MTARSVQVVMLSTLALYGCGGQANKPSLPNPGGPPPFANNPPPKMDPELEALAKLLGEQKPVPPEAQKLVAELHKLDGYVRVMDEIKDHTVIMLNGRDGGFSDDSLAKLRPAIKECPTRVCLVLEKQVTDTGLGHLKDLPSVEILYIRSEKVTAAGLETLASLPNLHGLQLSADDLSDAYLPPIAKMTGLRELSLHGKKLTDAGLAALVKLTEMKKLEIVSEKLTEACFAHFAGMTKMETLNVGKDYLPVVGDVGLAHIKGMTQLTKLRLGGKLTDAGTAHVKNFTELRELELNAPEVTGAGAANLGALKKLEKLEIRGLYVKGDGWAWCKELPNLRDLRLENAPDADGSMHLGKLTGLKYLSFGYGADCDQAMKGVGSLKGLETLYLSHTRVSDAGLEHLGGLTGLKTLELLSTRVTDAGMKYLSGLTNLESLTVGGCAITDAGLKNFTGMTKLQILYLADDKVTGSGFSHLSGLKNLKELRLDGNPVTSGSLAQLHSLPNLRTVFLTGTNVDDAAVLELKKKFPSADIRDVLGGEVRLEPPPARKKPQDLSRATTDFKLTPEEFTKEYQKSTKAFEEKFSGKVVELTGVVKWQGASEFGEPFINFDCDYILGCGCATVDPEPWAKVAPGQKVTLKGHWPGSAYGPSLHDCLFVNAPATQAVTVPMELLLKEYTASPEETVKKYEKKHLLVTGEVEARKIDRAGNATVHFKGNGKVHVACSFSFVYRDKSFVKSVTPGQRRVTMLGELQTSYTPGEINLRECLPITAGKK